MAEYAKKIFRVAFVDWDNQPIQFKEFEYGDILFTEDIPFKDGGTFEKWVDEDGNDVTAVTQNMVVVAKNIGGICAAILSKDRGPEFCLPAPVKISAFFQSNL